nr:MAG TPA: hypothetical protein [Caudoviricetes sp.]
MSRGQGGFCCPERSTKWKSRKLPLVRTHGTF